MERNELLKKVANLTDNINKKIRKFRSEGVGDFIENKLNYATMPFDKKDNVNITMESGFLTKSKKELGKLTDKELQKLYDNLQGVNKSKDYGTVKKFKIWEDKHLDKTASTLKDLIGNDKFNDLLGGRSQNDVVKDFIRRKEEESNKRGGTFSSTQILNDMILDSGKLSEEETQDTLRAIAKMERANELMRENIIDMQGRRKNGNRR